MTTAIGRTEIVELASGVYARLHEGLTNAGIIVGDDAVLVIDSLRVPSFARHLMEDVRRLSDKPIRYVIDTHYHWDHSFGNQEFPDSIIIGHANCRRELEEYGEASRQRAIDQGTEWSEELKTVEIRPPEITFDNRLELHFGGRRIDLMYLGRAHTAGDLFIHLPDDGVLFTGDVAQNGGVPYMLDGYMRDWVDTDTRLLEIPVGRFAAGHGPVGERSALPEARDFMAALVDGTERAIKDGRDEPGAQEAVTEELRDRFGSWRGFERVGDGIARAYRQLGGG